MPWSPWPPRARWLRRPNRSPARWPDAPYLRNRRKRASGRKSRKIAGTSTKNSTQTLAANTTISQPSSAETASVATASAVAPKTASVATASAVPPKTLAVSPLGTPEQLTAEQTAAETVNTLPVQLMKLVLQFGWTSTARQQFD